MPGIAYTTHIFGRDILGAREVMATTAVLGFYPSANVEAKISSFVCWQMAY